jgi:TatD DNase family protein
MPHDIHHPFHAADASDLVDVVADPPWVARDFTGPGPQPARRSRDECDNRRMGPSLIDTHCHLDAAEFARDRDAVKDAARAQGVDGIVIPAIAVSNFGDVARLAHATHGGAYALGIHPLLTPHASETDIDALRGAVEAALDDPRFVAIGEIGLDLFVPSLTTPAAVARQTWFFDEQLKIARAFDLPVLLHVRRAQDPVLAGRRRARRSRGGTATGIAHAFNGSRQQADAYLALGFRLGFGGASTFERALRIRALARDLPDEAIVLETDAPDIAPAWIHRAGTDEGGRGPAEASDEGAVNRGRNAPGELRRIAEVIGELRDVSLATLAAQTTRNALAVLPRLAASLPPQA